MADDILTIKEVAEYLKVNERTIYRLANKGDIPAFKVANAWRFRKSDVDGWIGEQTQSPKQPLESKPDHG
ncbi:predicted transcriptional regulator [Hahella chejuensis KCTC 2396]|uniref:Predicted transcriptional regulator n=1 Tax=Hahella chejuensis (strain KCTC 2396) TaxID=349521 RepID=Q2SGK6_HAHCH|nr:helix-turn-helix domain-containing protein [Hahella chejuensis]ABC30218.1 predicted transcriptional regulator [Hahella chejuensis KCTC 2396]